MMQGSAIHRFFRNPFNNFFPSLLPWKTNMPQLQPVPVADIQKEHGLSIVWSAMDGNITSSNGGASAVENSDVK